MILFWKPSSDIILQHDYLTNSYSIPLLCGMKWTVATGDSQQPTFFRISLDKKLISKIYWKEQGKYEY